MSRRRNTGRRPAPTEPITALGVPWATICFMLKVAFWTAFGFVAFLVIMSKRPE